MSLPTQARIVAVGGGIAGSSTAYPRSLMGERDVQLLEQGKARKAGSAPTTSSRPAHRQPSTAWAGRKGSTK